MHGHSKFEFYSSSSGSSSGLSILSTEHKNTTNTTNEQWMFPFAKEKENRPYAIWANLQLGKLLLRESEGTNVRLSAILSDVNIHHNLYTNILI